MQKKRWCGSLRALRKSRQNCKLSFKGEIQGPLINAVLFGNEQDVERELLEIFRNNNRTQESVEAEIAMAIVAAIDYYQDKDNYYILNLLLNEQKILQQKSNNSDSKKVLCAYDLLSIATKNIEAFKRISSIDSFETYKFSWRYENEGKTYIERMLDDDTFDQEHINIFCENNGFVAPNKDMHILKKFIFYDKKMMS